MILYQERIAYALLKGRVEPPRTKEQLEIKESKPTPLEKSASLSEELNGRNTNLELHVQESNKVMEALNQHDSKKKAASGAAIANASTTATTKVSPPNKAA